MVFPTHNSWKKMKWKDNFSNKDQKFGIVPLIIIKVDIDRNSTTEEMKRPISQLRIRSFGRVLLYCPSSKPP